MKKASIPSPVADGDGQAPAARRGITLIFALVVIAILGIMMFHLPPVQFAARRSVGRRHHGRQAQHLARAGVEFAIAAVLAGRNEEFRAEYAPIDLARVAVHVVPDVGQPEQFFVRSESAYPDTHPRHRMVHEVMRSYRLVRDEAGQAVACRFVAAFDPTNIEEPTPFHEALRQVRTVVRAGALGQLRKSLMEQQDDASPPTSQTPPSDAKQPAAIASQLSPLRQGRLDPTNVPLLIALLDDEEPLIRRRAAATLGQFPAERRIVDALKQATRDADETVQRAAHDALTRINPVAAEDADAP